MRESVGLRHCSRLTLGPRLQGDSLKLGRADTGDRPQVANPETTVPDSLWVDTVNPTVFGSRRREYRDRQQPGARTVEAM